MIESSLFHFVALILLGLDFGIATIVNVSLNFREYSIKSAVQKATMTAEIVKDGFNSETVRDAIDKEVLSTGKTVQKITESTENSMLRITIPYKASLTSNPNCLSCHNVNPGDTLGAISMSLHI